MELADINRREVLRYLGYKNQEADENVSRIVEDCLELLWKNVSPKYRVREFPLTLGADNRIDGCGSGLPDPEVQPPGNEPGSDLAGCFCGYDRGILRSGV